MFSLLKCFEFILFNTRFSPGNTKAQAVLFYDARAGDSAQDFGGFAFFIL